MNLGKALLTIAGTFSLIGCVGGNQATGSTQSTGTSTNLNVDVKSYDFLYEMPKGADLHSHLAGATMAENMIQYGYGGGLCIDQITYTVAKNSTCNTASTTFDSLLTNTELESATIDAWSMRNFNYAAAYGSDHFFATFGKYNAISKQYLDKILAEVVDRAGRQNEIYLELMITPDGSSARDLGTTLGWEDNLEAMYSKIMQTDQMKTIVDKMQSVLQTAETSSRYIMKCGTDQASPGCDVEIRYIYQVSRNQKPESVFAQMVAGFEAATYLKQMVGINMVQEEHKFYSLRDYQLHMQIIQFLKTKYPNVKVTLHAGELTPSFVSAEYLRDHIKSAVEIAKADRIGHGVDIKYEDNYPAILAEMAQRKVDVEINLTSNQSILGVTNANNPFPLYMAAGVPVTLSTDDEGILRINLTNEYVKAANEYNLDYNTLKNIARNSIEYSFAKGTSLWVDDTYKKINEACIIDKIANKSLSCSCQNFLNQNDKASLGWELEKRFAIFEYKFQIKQ